MIVKFYSNETMEDVSIFACVAGGQGLACTFMLFSCASLVTLRSFAIIFCGLEGFLGCAVRSEFYELLL